MFDEVDLDGNQTIDWGEFKDAMISVCGDTYMNQYPSWFMAREKVRLIDSLRRGIEHRRTFDARTLPLL